MRGGVEEGDWRVQDLGERGRMGTVGRVEVVAQGGLEDGVAGEIFQAP